MTPRSGVTNNTVKNMILDAGVIYKNYGVEGDEAIIGATDGGNTFLVEREVREIPVDGLKGKTKGLRRIISENAQLTVNLKEMSTENLQMALPGTTAVDDPGEDPTHDKITSNFHLEDGIVDAEADDYIANVAFVGNVSGNDEPVVIMLHNVLSDGNFELNATDQEEGVVELQLSAHYDPEDLDEPIYEIRYPKFD